MKSLFIHLSDLHFDNSGNPNCLNIKPFLNSFSSSSGFDNVFLIFTGDLTQGGSISELSGFKTIINRIISALRKQLSKPVELIIVPGNHDIVITKDNQEDINKLAGLSDKELYSSYQLQLKNEADVIEQCKNYGIDFSKGNGAVFSKTVKARNSSYHFVCINSSPFSLLDSTDKDKGFHFIPKNMRDINGAPEKNYDTIEVLVSHHRPDWFSYDSQRSLKNYEENISSFCFYGHEHINGHNNYVGKEGSTIISMGGELKTDNNTLKGTFLVHYIDTDLKTSKSLLYSYNNKTNNFDVERPNANYSFRVNSINHIDENYMDASINPSLLPGGSTKERDLFIMNLLRPNGSQNPIIDFNALTDFTNKNKKTFLFGYHGVGKTVLLHRLFEYYCNKKWVVYLDCEKEYSYSPKAMVDNAFSNIYKYKKSALDNFYESNTDDKVILVDNIDHITSQKSLSTLIDYLNESFGCIIISSNRNNVSSIKEGCSLLYDEDTSFNVEGFSLLQRRQLFEKVAHQNSITNEEDILNITKLAESSLSMCSVVDSSDPGTLFLLAEEIIRNKMYLERNTTDAFTIVFEHSIHHALVEASSETKLDEYIAYLNRLAFDVALIKKSIYFDEQDVKNAVAEKQSKFKHYKSKYHDFLNTIVSAKLVVLEGDNFRFAKNSYLAYFAAGEIILLNSKGHQEYLNNVVEQIVSGINGDIFVFAAYQLKQTKVFFDIQDELDSMLKDFEELSFEKKNNAVLSLNKKLIPETKEQSENKSRLYKRLDSQERKRIQSSHEKEKQAYDDIEDDKIKAVNKIVKLIEISCKAISGFNNNLDTDEREILLDRALSYTLKLINFLFCFDEKDLKEINDSFDELKAKTIEEGNRDNWPKSKIQAIQDLDLVHLLYDTLTTCTLNMISSIAKIITSKPAMPAVNKLDKDNFTHLLLKMLVYSEIGDVNAFINTMEDAYDNKIGKAEELIMLRVLRVFIIRNELKAKHFDKIASITNIKKERLLGYKA